MSALQDALKERPRGSRTSEDEDEDDVAGQAADEATRDLVNALSKKDLGGIRSALRALRELDSED